jgi:hypothetical protein
MGGRPGFEPSRTPVLAEGVDRRQQVVALVWVGGLVLGALGLWLVAIFTSGDTDRLEIAADLPEAAETSDSPDTSADDSTDDDREPGGDDEEAGAEGSDDPLGDLDGTDGTDEAAGDDAATPVTIDEICTVEVSETERRDGSDLRAWEYPDCAYAPVPIEERRERWIVVRASMGANDFDAGEAEQRATDLGVDGGVLWSSHYPSLNPDLWVVYEGPFADRSAARDAADAVSGEAYARALTVDEDDRFCIAADGCVGERAE